MLRSKLYIGMFPVAGLLILVCLYSVYNHAKLSRELDRLQIERYGSISQVERVLLATSQLERAILLEADGEHELARSAYERSMPVFENWMESDQVEEDLTPFLRNLMSMGTAVFEGKNGPRLKLLNPLVEQIEAAGFRSISDNNSIIKNTNDVLRGDSQTHFYVVVSAIVASVFLMGYVAFQLSQRILKPIDALTESAARIGDGQYDMAGYTPSSKDEIARLENAFVEMAGRIAEYQRLTDKQVARTRRRMEECFNNLPNPVVFLNTERDLAYQNPAALELLSHVSWDAALLPQLTDRIEKVFGTGEEIVETDFDETVSVKIGNETRFFLPIFVRVDSDAVDEIECGLVLQDITQLRLSDELKSDMVATVSHEIKTPVTSATMALHLVLEKSLGELTNDQEDMLQMAVDDLARLRRLLDHFLEIARLERKSPRLDSVVESPLRIISSVIDAFSMASQSKDIQLVSQVEETLPKVSVDLKAIEVGLSNYVSNAIKFSPAGSKVEVYACLVGSRVRFGVRDEGPGLSEEDREIVFEKFYRSRRHRKIDGVGLGLSIVKDIAIAHDGSVGCAPLSPRGCDFFLEIDPVDSREKIDSAAV
ncbi:ATP-binding protein [Pelagicoccus sp. SDUM812002]|uniref:sensor histidine kinase n=1 Tax=Pelagicoccus sp. SDUM812002 TaxID=3041266 RepID=UPI00281062B0|nr:ATP-binding protein [Pelagicoccus sp. SDUM812002]MDQ8185284.1 ATP-binding protein [Pelagicoccus sp. SDUM812002]